MRKRIKRLKVKVVPPPLSIFDRLFFLAAFLCIGLLYLVLFFLIGFAIFEFFKFLFF